MTSSSKELDRTAYSETVSVSCKNKMLFEAKQATLDFMQNGDGSNDEFEMH